MSATVAWKGLAAFLAAVLLVSACSSGDEDALAADEQAVLELCGYEMDTSPIEPVGEPVADDATDPAGEAPSDIVSVATYDDGGLSMAEIDAARVTSCAKTATALTCPAGMTDDGLVLLAHVIPNRLLVWDGENLEIEEVEADNLRELTEARQQLFDEFAGDVLVEFDYYLLPTMSYGVGPADNPTSVGARYDWQTARPQNGSAGEPVQVVVADTGYVEAPPGFDFLSNVDTRGGFEQLPDATADPSVGHGLMVAGVVGQRAPDADVIVLDARDSREEVNPFSPGTKHQLLTVSSFYNSVVAGDLNPADVEVSVLNMSFGTYVCLEESPESVSGQQLELLQDLMVKLADDHILVAAAGNNNTTVPFYPAAFDNVLGVGAIDDTIPNICDPSTTPPWVLEGSPLDTCAEAGTSSTWFSNTGPSADVCAPGTDIVTAYPNNLTFAYLDENHQVVETATPGPLVRISGTSFAAPYISAYLVTEGRASLGITVDEWAGQRPVIESMFTCP